VDALKVIEDGIYIDGTYGRGGHAGAILERLGAAGRLVVVDRDPQAIEHAEQRMGADPRVGIVHAGFDQLEKLAEEEGIHGQVNGLLLDLGVSSPQLDSPERGFSFREDGPLDMRMDPGTGESAADWLARAEEAEIARIIKEYGEERFARRIARSIVMARSGQRIERTAQLAELVERTLGRRPGDRHPATRTFQAIRIHVNRELESLDEVLDAGIRILAPGGRFVVISFHSLEDRRVKQQFLRAAKPPPTNRRLPVDPDFRPQLKLVGRLVRPDDTEEAVNPRSRSSRMRVAEKL